MTRNEIGKSAACCSAKTLSQNSPCCKVEALIPIDGRGQIVLPKDLRDKAGIEAGDKLAVISFESDGKVCCITLVRADDFAETIKGMLGPIMKEIL
ncbi:MAG: AbrB/MazE/SpoVT family DNA-binding domain-containing protein [Candidatus Abyssobacteria bacterium SURF_17]|uniref:AbrB/MazE/SpoVT family DNA-binding domain-containing protein n=1 Tax=Candidatus Abyssobacteria bacterium SURF_17 TaxID=2093361 RepID=A0A419F4J8_9BACT|nr:MAG: AbrB/MazE/SpoVT family DNA-binding domain-containing protein [Candidatus Abyssubacteria bacterium SURF_17]